MLSPGTDYLKVPKEPLANARWREQLYLRCAHDETFRRGILAICQNDFLFYVNAFVWQYNPDEIEDEVGPFVSWPFQDEAAYVVLDHIERRKDLLVEKSRELGWTWWALLIDDWVCRFRKRKKFSMISHSELAVDRPDDPATLFWKIRFVNDHLPDFFPQVRRRKLNLAYPETESTMNGAATTVRSTVGGRDTQVLLDEFAKQQAAYEIDGNTADVGPRLFISTHYGPETHFCTLANRPDLDKIVSHWSQHPKKCPGLYRSGVGIHGYEIMDKTYKFPHDFQFVRDGSPTGGPYPGLRSVWYDEECLRRQNPRDIASHLDINPQGSVSQYFNPNRIRELIAAACDPWSYANLIYDRDIGEPDKLVQTPMGLIRLWCKLDVHGRPPPGPYVLGGDISRGHGRTPTCFSMVRQTTGEKVLEYINAKIHPLDAGVFAVALAKWFYDAFMIWEKQGPGQDFAARVLDLGYRNIYWERNEKSLFKKQATAMLPGFNASQDNQDRAITEYAYALARGHFTNWSKPALEECLLFRFNVGSRIVHGEQTIKRSRHSTADLSGASISHADIVMADAMAWLMCKEYFRAEVERPKKEIKTNTLAYRKLMAEDAQRATALVLWS